MKTRSANALRTRMIKPLYVMILCVVTFSVGYLIGMFHTWIAYTFQDDGRTISEPKEKYITLTHKVGDQ